MKLVDTRDLKSRRLWAVPVRFRPRAPFLRSMPTHGVRYYQIKTMTRCVMLLNFMRLIAKYCAPVVLLVLSVTVEAKLEADVAQVLRVVDGDSITVKVDETNYRIRLAEIDAPEMDQAWGEESKSALQEKLGNEEVALEIIDVDRYSRLVARVFLNGRQINREMVEEGHAWVYLEYLRDETLLDPEGKAKKKKLGLWASEAAVAPWLWRKRKR